MYAEQRAQGQSAVAMTGIGGAVAGFANEAKRESEIPGALCRLDSRLHELQEAIHMLDGRLTGSVARSSPPTTAPAGQLVRAAMQTGFGSQLDSLQERTQAAYLQLRDLIDRLEV